MISSGLGRAGFGSVPRASRSLLRPTALSSTSLVRPSAHRQLLVSRSDIIKRLSSSSTPDAVPPKRSFLKRHRFLGGLLWGGFSVVFGISATIAIILAHDALTYRHPHLEKVTPSPLALHPQPGGPKNLPIVSEYVEGDEDDSHKQLKEKERLVIVGGGWAAVSLLSKLDPGKYNVTLVAPNNFYLFTPLLPSATVGTVEPRSLIEPIRKVLSRHRGHYIQGKAVDVELGSLQAPCEGGAQRLLEVQLVSGESNAALAGRSHPEAGTDSDSQSREEVEGRRIYIPYDKLIVAVGSVTSTHGVPGLQNAFHLKEIDDARGIRSRILDNLEIASLPTTSPEERQRLLSFVISGGGPTGVETAAEIYDMLNEDVLDYYPKLLRQQAKVSLIQSRSHILNTYSEKISKYAEEKFARDAVDVIVNARVKEVKENSVVYTVKDAEGAVTEHEIPSGMTLWSTGIAMSPFTKRMTNILPNQSHLKALLVDSHLRVQGTPPGTVYALGDASTVDTRLIDSLYDFVDSCDSDHDGRLTFDEFSLLAGRVGKKFPLASKHFVKLRDLFDNYDLDKDGTLSLNEVAKLFLETQNKMTSLPATAQVASQEGAYLAKKLNKLAKVKAAGKGSSQGEAGNADQSQGESASVDFDDEHYKPFQYQNLGALVFLGGEAAAFDSLPLPEPVRSFAGGLVAMYAWRSFYLSEQVSTRTRLLLLSDYIRRGIWGRDLSRL
ncbi:unnamed protein product [Parajaminaea phylloscopi]